MGVREKLLTVEEFWAQYAGKLYELVDGRVVPTWHETTEGATITLAPAGGTHGATERRVAKHLSNFVDPRNLGEIYSGETGFALGPNILRGAEVAFIGRGKLARITEPAKFIPFAPDLAVEVVSPNDTASEVARKVEEYLNAGTAIVWFIYPEIQQVVVHLSDRTAKTYTLTETLDGGDVLPGLQIAVSDLFPPVNPSGAS